MREKLTQIKFIKGILNRIWKFRAEDVDEKISSYLQAGDKILDIGAGSCQVTEILLKKGFEAVALDVANLSVVDGIKPVIYGGENIPFDDNSYDVSLLISVLHHTKNPNQVLREAKRVAKRIIVMEDIYHDDLHKYLTYAMDSIVNLEFFGHPHSNNDDREWKKIFKKLGLKLLDSKEYPYWRLFISGTYYLKKY